MKKTIIYGLGDFASLIRYYLEEQGHEIAAFVADKEYCYDNFFDYH